MTDNTAHTVSDRLRAEASHFQKLPQAQNAEHFQDHVGISIWGKAGDVDIFFGATMYHVGGRKWGFDDAALNQTYLLITPTGDRTMGNNAFVANRMDPVSRFDFRETVEHDKVTWTAGNREVTFSPPVWEVRGEHFGVDLDLKLTGIGDPVPYHGTWDGLVEHGVAGNEVLCQAQGSCTYNGKTYTLDSGWGVRERTCLGYQHDVPSLLGTGSGYFWSWTFSEDIKVFYFSQGGSGHSAGRVFLDDRIIDFEPQQTVSEALESWTDPLTHETQVTRMRIGMKSDQGELELEVNTWSRLLFGFHLLEAYTTHTGKCGRAKGQFTFPDGRVISIDESLCYIEHGFATPMVAA
jgi:hypothetical protein